MILVMYPWKCISVMESRERSLSSFVIIPPEIDCPQNWLTWRLLNDTQMGGIPLFRVLAYNTTDRRTHCQRIAVCFNKPFIGNGIFTFVSFRFSMCLFRFRWSMKERIVLRTLARKFLNKHTHTHTHMYTYVSMNLEVCHFPKILKLFLPQIDLKFCM